MVNKVILVGRAGRDAELRFTQSGRPVANFSMATSESWKDKDGEKQERTEWHRVQCWGPLAEKLVGPYVTKGKQVYVEGRLQTDKWQDKECKDRYTTQVVANTVHLIGGGGKSEHSDDDRSPQESRESIGTGNPDDDIPF